MSMDQNTRQTGYIRVSLPECVVSTLSGPPPETKDTPNPRIGIKIPDPAGNRTRSAGLEGRDSTDHTTATDKLYKHRLKTIDSKDCVFTTCPSTY